MKKAIIGIFFAIIIWAILGSTIFILKHGDITFDNIFDQTKPALIAGFSILLIYLIIRKRK